MRGRPIFINFAVMKTFSAILLSAVLLCSCREGEPPREAFTIETMNKITPVKDQGRSPLCWVYAMLAVIESDRLMMGDSVNISPAYTARRVLERRTERSYLSRGREAVTADGTAVDLVAALEEFGAMPYDAYRSDCSYDAVCRKLDRLVAAAASRRAGLNALRRSMAGMLDAAINPLPRSVWMYGAEYTVHEFANSLCLPGDYVSMTSYTHEPFNESVNLDIPANRRGARYLNIPVDTLVSRVVAALHSGRSVCWEGDTSNRGFSFRRGLADLGEGHGSVTQAMRQRAFERFAVTDDHCMAIVGTARDGSGRLWFICKNSWGTDNPYGGLMYMSVPYFRLNTVAVVMRKPD